MQDIITITDDQEMMRRRLGERDRMRQSMLN
jgi:hypothetical protein